MLKRLALITLFLIGAYQAWSQYTQRALDRPDGVLVASAPVQMAIENSSPHAFGAFALTPLANFRVQGRVLLLSRYRLDAESALAPYDLGLGWQRMSDSAVLRGLDLKQTGRFLLWHWRHAPPIPEDEINRSAANIHLIPADADIRAQIARLRPGQLVSLSGQLVAATRNDGWHWRSSLSREDSGRGACELMYVESIALD